MALALLSEPVVLDSTRELGDFDEDALIPHRLGVQDSAPFRLIRLGPDVYLVAGHPYEVANVFVGRERTLSWEQELRRNATGRVWHVVKFAAPIDADLEVWATGRGGKDPNTGALIENPADLMAYVMRLHGRADVIFPDLRAQAAAEGLRLKLNLDSTKPAKDWLDEIALCAGAMWTPSSSRLYPTDDVVGSVIELDPYFASGIEPPTRTLEDAADVLRIAYDRSDASGRAQQAITLSASPQLYGGVKVELELPHLYLPANAETVGTRLLTWMAAKRALVNFECRRSDIKPGQWVRLVDHPEWTLDAEPLLMIRARDVAPNAGRSRLTGEVRLTTPRVKVTSHSVALSNLLEGGADVSFEDGVARFSFVDPDGRPSRGVRVTLDGSHTLVSGDDGRVTFTDVASGVHALTIAKPGFVPQSTTFVMP